ncbi:hypothetical protein CEXT_562861 [Caerostris extrusa]|uniref:Uncharacterized protein n=1 Tax=Caerostris extrusa TaxID=172846 RepID=A0AAV4WN31_CAEEX|nr:hypothetical protein CEXT_562861 [Caerostris extrusa]
MSIKEFHSCERKTILSFPRDEKKNYESWMVLSILRALFCKIFKRIMHTEKPQLRCFLSKIENSLVSLKKRRTTLRIPKPFIERSVNTKGIGGKEEEYRNKTSEKKKWSRRQEVVKTESICKNSWRGTFAIEFDRCLEGPANKFSDCAFFKRFLFCSFHSVSDLSFYVLRLDESTLRFRKLFWGRSDLDCRFNEFYFWDVFFKPYLERHFWN